MGAALVALAQPRLRIGPALLCGIVTLFALALLLPSTPAVQGGNAVLSSHQWMPAIGLSLSFRLDGLSLLFALLIEA